MKFDKSYSISIPSLSRRTIFFIGFCSSRPEIWTQQSICFPSCGKGNLDDGPLVAMSCCQGRIHLPCFIRAQKHRERESTKDDENNEFGMAMQCEICRMSPLPPQLHIVRGLSVVAEDFPTGSKDAHPGFGGRRGLARFREFRLAQLGERYFPGPMAQNGSGLIAPGSTGGGESGSNGIRRYVTVACGYISTGCGYIIVAWGYITVAGQWVLGVASAITLPWWGSLSVASAPVALLSWFRGTFPFIYTSFVVLAVIGGLIWTIAVRDQTIVNRDQTIHEQNDTITDLHEEIITLRQQLGRAQAARDEATSAIREAGELLQNAIVRSFDQERVGRHVGGILKLVIPYMKQGDGDAGGGQDGGA